MTWTVSPSDAAYEIEDVDSASHHPRLPAVLVPSVDNEHFALVTDRATADRHWHEAWAAEGMSWPPAETFLAGFMDRFDDVLSTHPQCTGPDPDPALWELTERAGDDIAHAAPDGTGSWALSVWTLDYLRYQRFPHLGVASFERLARSLLHLVQQSPIGRLVCWKRRMDDAGITFVSWYSAYS